MTMRRRRHWLLAVLAALPSLLTAGTTEPSGASNSTRPLALNKNEARSAIARNKIQAHVKMLVEELAAKKN
jgi:hypothetical protein